MHNTGDSNITRSTLTGENNVGLGYDTIVAVTFSGSANTAVGSNTLRALVDKNFNTGVGFRAGYATTGECNTFIGNQAGQTNVAGYNNVIIGSIADTSSITAVNQVVIGQNANGHDDHIVVIGNNLCEAWHPDNNGGVDLGSSSYKFKNLYLSDISCTNINATLVDVTTVDVTTISATTVNVTLVDATTVDVTTISATTIGADTINVTSMATSNLTVSNLIFPTSDGTAGQVLKTDGSNQLGWTSFPDSINRHITVGNGGITILENATMDIVTVNNINASKIKVAVYTYYKDSAYNATSFNIRIILNKGITGEEALLDSNALVTGSDDYTFIHYGLDSNNNEVTIQTLDCDFANGSSINKVNINKSFICDIVITYLGSGNVVSSVLSPVY